MKKVFVIALALLLVGAPLLVSCSEKIPMDNKKKETEKAKPDSLRQREPGVSYIIYEAIPF